MPEQRKYKTYKNGHAHGNFLYPIFMSKKDHRYKRRYKILSGGRDAAKTIAICRFLLERITTSPTPLTTGFIRQNLKDTRTSCAIVVRNWIHTMNLQNFFHIPDGLESPIVGIDGSVIYMIGANEQTSGGIKSFEGLDIVILEEAQYITETAWEIITPTIRSEDSEIWVNYNPRFRTDPISAFVEDTKGDEAVFFVHLTHRDNQYRTNASETERRLAKKRLSQSDYEHVWEGKFKESSDEKTLLLYEWLETAVRAFPEIWKKWPEDEKLKNHHTGSDFGISLDGDGNAHVRRVGPFLLKFHQWGGRALYKSASRINKLNRPFPVNREYFDPIGIGAEYSSYRPNARPIPKNGMVAGKERYFSTGRYNEDHFMNRGSQMGWVLRMRAQNTYEKFIEGLPNIELRDCLFISPGIARTTIERAKFLAQLNQPVWDTENPRDLIHIEKEPDGRPSPNYYDATEQAFAADSTLGLKEGIILSLQSRKHQSAII